MVLQMRRKAKLPPRIAERTKLEVSCGFTAPLARRGRGMYPAGGPEVSPRSPYRREAEDTSLCSLFKAVRALWTHLIWAGWEASRHLIPRHLGISAGGSSAWGWKMVSAGWQLLSSPQFIALLGACTDASSVMMLFGPHLPGFSVPSRPPASALGTSGKTNHA